MIIKFHDYCRYKINSASKSKPFEAKMCNLAKDCHFDQGVFVCRWFGNYYYFLFWKVLQIIELSTHNSFSILFYEICIKPIYQLNFSILGKWCIRESASKYCAFKKITENSLWFTKCSNTKIKCSLALTCPMLMG